MSKFFVKTEQINNNDIVIIGDDVNHIINVLRMKTADEIQICNQDTGDNYNAEIVNYSKNEVECKIISRINETTESNVHITLFQGIPKFEKMELIIQKNTEVGIKSIVPVIMERTVVKLDEKIASKKLERWQKIAESAAKQSGRNTIPQVKNIHTIKDLINIKDEYDAIIVCYENEKTNSLKKELKSIKEMLKAKLEIKIAVVIGPEGGLEEKDVEELQQNGAKIVTLGNIILRTETVALNILSVIMYEFSEF